MANLKFFTLILFVPLFFVLDRSFADSSLKIGVILPLSGQAASFGRSTQNGVSMAVSDKIKEGNKLEVIFEDDAMKSSNTLAAYSKLTMINKVDAVICFASNTCNSVNRLAEKDGIPLIAIASDKTISKDKSYVFNLWVTPEVQNDALYGLLSAKGLNRVAVVTTIHEGSMAVKDDLLSRYKDKFNFVFEYDYSPEHRDFKSEMPKLISAKPDALILILMPGQSGIFARRLREYKSEVPIFSYEIMEDESELKVSNGALTGAIIATADNGNSEFLNNYKLKFPNSSMVASCNGYDAISLLSLGFRQGKSSRQASQILRELKDYNGACGTFSATGDNRFNLPAVLKVARGDGFHLIN